MQTTLRGPFHSQCYLAAFSVIGFSGGAVLIRYAKVWSVVSGVGVALLTLLVFGLCQAFWFAMHLNVSKPRGFWIASQGMVISLLASAAVGRFFG